MTFAAFVLVAGQGACITVTDFECTRASQCTAGLAGRCLDGGCAYADEACPSGYRFSDLAAVLGGECVSEFESGGESPSPGRDVGGTMTDECEDWKWADPAPIPNVNTPDRDTHAHLSRDGLTVVFDAFGDLDTVGAWWARRPTLDAPFAPPSYVGDLGPGGAIYAPSLSWDGLGLYFYTGGRIYRAWRDSLDDSFVSWEPLPKYAGDEMVHRHPSESADGLRLYFTIAPSGDDETQLAVASRPSLEQPYTFDRVLDEVNVPGAGHSGPFEAADGLSLLFGSNRGGVSRLYAVTRTSFDDRWSDAIELEGVAVGVNSDLHSPSMTPDGHELIFATLAQVPESSGGWDLWYATRSCRMSQ